MAAVDGLHSLRSTAHQVTTMQHCNSSTVQQCDRTTAVGQVRHTSGHPAKSEAVRWQVQLLLLPPVSYTAMLLLPTSHPGCVQQYATSHCNHAAPLLP